MIYLFAELDRILGSVYKADTDEHIFSDIYMFKGLQ